VRPYRIVVDAPRRDDPPSLGERGEYLFIQIFVAHRTGEALDDGILCRLTRRDAALFD